MATLRPPEFLDLSNWNLRITARWQVWVLVVLALAAAAGLAWVAAYLGPLVAILAAAAPMLIVGSIVIMPRREAYPFVLLALALFVPLSLPTGRDSRLVLSLIFAIACFGFTVLYVFAFRRPVPFVASTINRPFIAWAVVVVIALVWSIAFRDSKVWVWPSFPFVQFASAIVMVMLPFATMMSAHFLKTERQLKLLVCLFLFAGVIGLVPRFGLAPLPVNINGMFNLWVVALAGGLAAFVKRYSLWQRVFLGLLAGAYFFWGLLFYVDWLAGWLPGVIAVAIMIVNRSRFAAVLTGLCVAVAMLASVASIDEQIATENGVSGVTRMAAWGVNWSITKDHLLFGTGPAGYAAYYMAYMPDKAMATHSNYIDILAETGLVGMAVYLWLWLTFLWLGFRMCYRLRGRGDFLEALANAAFAGTVACFVIMGFGDWLVPFAYTQTIMGFDYAVYNWIFIGTLVVIDRLTAPNQTAMSPAQSVESI